MSDRAFSAATARSFAAQRVDPERRSYFSELGRRSATARRGGIILTREEAATLLSAFTLLRRALQRARRQLCRAELAAQGTVNRE